MERTTDIRFTAPIEDVGGGTPELKLTSPPGNIALRMGWMTDVSNPHKVLAALAEVGKEECYCNLRLRTGLAPRAFQEALGVLLDEGYIRMIESPYPERETSTLEHYRVRLCKKL